MKVVQELLAVIGVLFGIATITAGARVLLGADPGYAVFKPLVVYNTVMGAAYIAAGILAWLNLRRGLYAAAAIFVLNLCVLGIVGYLYATQAVVAVESVGAMTLRIVVWFVLFLGLAWLVRRNGHTGR